MKKEIYNNRVNVSFRLDARGDDMVRKANAIHALSKKHNAQENIYENASHLKFGKNGNVVGEATGSIGGAITFHSHSCDPEAAANELVALLDGYGCQLSNVYNYDEEKRELVKVK